MSSTDTVTILEAGESVREPEDDRTVNELVNDALLRWVEITGVDLDATSFTVNPFQNFNSWTIRKYTEQLNESRDLDPTGLTTFMMLRGIWLHYLKEVVFSAHDLITGREKVDQYLVPLAGLRTVLEHPRVVALIEDFLESMREAANLYGVPVDEDYESWLTDKYEMAMIRRDALLAMDKLETHQFTWGEPGEAPMGYNPKVYEFWNINSLIRAMRRQARPGVTLCMIRDPDVAHSFFVFAIKNGDRIYLLTDRAKKAHPLQKGMGRGRVSARELDRRADQFWFPYDLLNVEFSEDRKHVFEKAGRLSGMVPFDSDGVALKDFKDLHPAQCMWLALMLDRIRERFYNEQLMLPDLSYTGEMVVEPHSLVGESAGLVKDGHYVPLQVEPLVKADVTQEAMSEQWESSPTGGNQWMVGRYGHLVPDEILNPVGEIQAALIGTAMVEQGHLVPTKSRQHRHFESSSDPNDPTAGLARLDPLTFGTAEKLEKDRRFIARTNWMKSIQVHANREFEETKGEALAWWEKKLRTRQEWLLNTAVTGTLILPGSYRANAGNGAYWGEYNGLEIGHGRRFASISWSHNSRWPRVMFAGRCLDFSQSAQWGGAQGWVPAGQPQECGRRACPDTDQSSTIFFYFELRLPESIAKVLGCKVADLPWQLQHAIHSNLERHGGNHLLRRVDPMGWAVKNPWNRLGLTVGICMSKKGVNARRKAQGLEVFRGKDAWDEFANKERGH